MLGSILIQWWTFHLSLYFLHNTDASLMHLASHCAYCPPPPRGLWKSNGMEASHCSSPAFKVRAWRAGHYHIQCCIECMSKICPVATCFVVLCGTSRTRFRTYHHHMWLAIFAIGQMQCLSTFLSKCFYVFVICLPYIGLRQRVHQCLWRVWSVDPSVIPALTGRVHRPSNDDELRLMCLKNCWDLCSLFSSSLNQKTQDEVISWVYIYICTMSWFPMHFLRHIQLKMWCGGMWWVSFVACVYDRNQPGTWV